VLSSCEVLLPAAESVSLVSRLIATIAINVCKEQLTPWDFVQAGPVPIAQATAGVHG
jgi:hypothetical protein